MNPRNLEAVRYWMAEGGRFAAATGRALAAFRRQAAGVPMNAKNAHVHRTAQVLAGRGLNGLGDLPAVEVLQGEVIPAAEDEGPFCYTEKALSGSGEAAPVNPRNLEAVRYWMAEGGRRRGPWQRGAGPSPPSRPR